MTSTIPTRTHHVCPSVTCSTVLVVHLVKRSSPLSTSVVNTRVFSGRDVSTHCTSTTHGTRRQGPYTTGRTESPSYASFRPTFNSGMVSIFTSGSRVFTTIVPTEVYDESTLDLPLSSSLRFVTETSSRQQSGVFPFPSLTTLRTIPTGLGIGYMPTLTRVTVSHYLLFIGVSLGSSTGRHTD